MINVYNNYAIVLLGLVFMGRHKCEAVACLSIQVKCNFMNCLLCTLFMANKFDLIWYAFSQLQLIYSNSKIYLIIIFFVAELVTAFNFLMCRSYEISNIAECQQLLYKERFRKKIMPFRTS